MFEINLSSLENLVMFMFAWGVAYFISVIFRFGSSLTRKTEIIAILCSLLVPIIAFTDIFIFTTN
ncbi:MAG: hypothetical protein ACI88H_002814 [Cocleimonas sp.]|jgi:hypothetical protein